MNKREILTPKIVSNVDMTNQSEVVISPPETEKILFQEAMEKNLAGDIDGAIASLKKLDTKNPNCALYKASLGKIFWNQNKIDAALDSFRAAIQLAPDWELASLGFFHVLWEQGKTDEAFEEIKRFQRVSHSEDYVKIIREINERF